MARISEETPLVLGSASPRRSEILRRIGVAHVVAAAEVDERVHAHENVEAYLARVVLAKLVGVRATLPSELTLRAAALLVADTSVVLDGDILGKPSSVDEALAMIERLSGRTHEVLTRFAIADASAGRDVRPNAAHSSPDHVESVVTRVTFRLVCTAEARAYAAAGEGLDKAGGYAVQGFASAFVSRIEGSYDNVVGLPACQLVVALRALGLR